MSGFAVSDRHREPPAFASTWVQQIGLIALLIASIAIWLTVVGRPLICTCGTVRLFVFEASSRENSQQVADFYSGLHVVFGFALWLFVHWMKPHWLLGQKLLVAVASSVAWEAIENLPFVIAMFGNAPGSPPYAGDTILNALFDTAFVGTGFLVASALPPAAIVVLAVAIELGVSFAIDDGFVYGTLRLFGVSI